MAPALASRKARPGTIQFCDQILHQTFAQLELQHLAEPALRDVEHQQAPAMQPENAELHQELARSRDATALVEWLVPAIEQDLSVGGGDDHRGKSRPTAANSMLRTGETHRARSIIRLRHEAGLGNLVRFRRAPSRSGRLLVSWRLYQALGIVALSITSTVPYCHGRLPSVGRIDTLIGAMTLAEKLGQLTMTAAGYAVTGPIIAGDSTEPSGRARSAICSIWSAPTMCARCSVWRSRSRGSAFRCCSASMSFTAIAPCFRTAGGSPLFDPEIGS